MAVWEIMGSMLTDAQLCIQLLKKLMLAKVDIAVSFSCNFNTFSANLMFLLGLTLC